jgi:uncharacterized protein
MSAYFLDSSALVKRFAQETGTAFVFSLLRPSAHHTLYAARLTEVEVCAALARRRKLLTLSPAQASKAQRRFRRDFPQRFIYVALNDSIVDEAVRLADAYVLRGYDAIQLASALFANSQRLLKSLPSLIFVSADIDLNQAAQSRGLAIENPNNYP